MKQVILVRKDLNMSPGKACAQVAHAGMLFILDKLNPYNTSHKPFTYEQCKWMFEEKSMNNNWQYGGIKKIVLGVEDLYGLDYYANMTKYYGMEVHYVFDEGLQDWTCCAIGPDKEENFINLTNDLPLY